MRKTFLSMRCILVSIFLIITLFSCSPYGATYIRIKKPAKVHIPNDVNSICFVIRSTLSEKQDSIIRSSKIQKDFYDRSQSFYDISFEGFFDKLKDDGRYSNIMYYKDSTVYAGDSIVLKPLNWVKVSNICMQTNSAFLIVLENPIIFHTPLNPEQTEDVSIYWNYKIRIYDLLNFRIIDELSFSNQEVFNLSSYDISLDGLVAQKAYDLGDKIAGNLEPKYSTAKRIYFNKGNSLLRLGSYYFIGNDYDNAVLVWKKLIEKPVKAELAYMACYNISLIEELRNNLTSSFKFANMSYNFLKFSKIKKKKKDKNLLLVKKRISDIKQRILDEDILNK